MNCILAPAILVLAIAAGAASAETRNFSGFTGVNAKDGVEVSITTGERYSVQVTGREASRVRTRIIDNDTLEVSQINRRWWGNHGLDAAVTITVPHLNSLSASRGAQVQATNITATNMEIAAAMGGIIEISGRCSDLDASVAMGGVLEADEFECQNADISAAMGGIAEVFASGNVDASASMGGNIDVAGGGRGDSSSSMGGVISFSN